MPQKIPVLSVTDIPRFDRHFFGGEHVISRIGGGAIGGKASGLAFADTVLQKNLPGGSYQGITVSIPRFVVIGTDVFDAFLERNDLGEVAQSDTSDDRIGMAFQRAEFPAEFAGDLRGLVSTVHAPLAVRSSSMLEDAMYEPFAGVYGTKMIPNNQPDTDTRYRKLIDAIKFVYASTFFRGAKSYLSITRQGTAQEKMAVIIQEVVGLRHRDRFYPNVSGVGRSYNFYPVGHAQPEEGVVDLALGLGKTIVDGGRVWTYSPAFPQAGPPFTTGEMLSNTQTDFWAVNMGKPPTFDPMKETEYLIKADIKDAESDDSIRLAASTYQPQNDRIVMGTGADGPRILNFGPLLQLHEVPFNDLVTMLLQSCQQALDVPVEIEFAVTTDRTSEGYSVRFGFLQVRPMVVSSATVDITDDELEGDRSLLASERTMGNGVVDNLTDIIYVKPDLFGKEHTRTVAAEIDELSKRISDDSRGYVLIGFGRWGSSDPWLGIPVDWGSIGGARVIVEATLPDMDVELSQGSHFFHNITSLQIPYLCVRHSNRFKIDWLWLESQPIVAETKFVRHVRLAAPLTVKIDGRGRKGVILR
ncbi:MAG: hypothetical protein KAW46_00385 [candidate division Zixibacteria bacterium]|nr:hypothetical protein [candidate division Zixibacteria bacterium]